jgi:hypothetical protein
VSGKQNRSWPVHFSNGEPAFFLIIVALAFAVFLSQNPSGVLPRTTLYFDSAHYLESCKRLYEACLAFAGSGFQTSRGELDSLAFYLLLDGPVLPSAGAILFLCLHKLPALSEWQNLVAMQCFFQACGSGFLYLLSRLFFRLRWFGILAACAWTCYPGAICSCNSFLTEPLACTVSIAFPYFISAMLPSATLKQGGASQAVQEEKANPVADIQVEDRRSNAMCFLAGVCLALLAFLKPALAPAAGTVLLVWLVWQWLESGATADRRQKRICRPVIMRPLLALVGIALVLAPWIAFGYAVRGHLVLLTSRRPVYNITMGCNVEGDGWGWYPTHPVALMFDDNEPPLPVALGLIEGKPGEIANLNLRKITRFLTLPWNDYRYKILGLNFRLQSIWQLVVVAMGFSGLLLLFANCFSRAFSTKQKLVIVSLLVVIFGHLVYLPFEGIARYGITAMPCIFIGSAFMAQELIAGRKRWGAILFFFLSLSVWVLLCKVDLIPNGLELLSRLPYPHGGFRAAFLPSLLTVCVITVAVLRTLAVLALSIALWRIAGIEKTNRAARLALAAAGAFFVVVAAAMSGAFAVSNREALLWQCTLKNGLIAERELLVEPSSLKNADWALLLVDGDQHIPEARFFVNDRQLKTPVRSIYQFDSELYLLEDWLNQFASLLRKSPDSVRRWRAVEVPLSLVRGGYNKLAVADPSLPGAAVTIYGDYRRLHDGKRLLLPSQKEVSPGKFFNDSEDAFDSRIEQTTFSSGAYSHCALVQNGTAAKGIPGRSDKPAADFCNELSWNMESARNCDLSPSPGLQTGEYRFFLLLGYPHNPGKTGKDLPADKTQASKVPDSYNEMRINLVAKVLSGAKTAIPAEIRLKANSRRQFNVFIPPAALALTHLGVRISGMSCSESGAVFSVAGTITGGKRLMDSVLPGTPCVLNAGPDWKPFSLGSQLPCQKGRTDTALLRVEIQALKDDIDLSDLQVEFQPLQLPQFSNHSIRYF